MSPALRALLSGAIDYAGLFPPAALSLDSAVAEYQRHLHEPAAWMVGTFVVPVGRLGELASSDLLSAEATGSGPQKLSVIGRGGEGESTWQTALEEDFAALSAFVAKHPRQVEFTSYEVRLPRGRESFSPSSGVAAAIRAAGEKDSRPLSLGGVFLEIPQLAKPDEIRQQISHISKQAANNINVGAKFRMGSPDETTVPSIESVAAMIDACRRNGLRWKATAGLHHALRAAPGGQVRLGFLNVFVAAVLATACEFSTENLQAILSDEAAESFTFDDDGLTWRDFRASVAQVEAARREALVSFGSCSIAEPWEELQQLKLVEQATM